jgi:hypothetical protein
MLVGEEKEYQLIGNGAQPFRVTSSPELGQMFSVVYVGGVASSAPNNAWYRGNPKKYQ